MIGPAQVWDFLKDAEEIHIASGQKVLHYQPAQANREELLKKATGPTGNLRAPTLRLGADLYIGFNQALYSDLFG